MEFSNLTDVQLIEEIKRQWYEAGQFEYERMYQMDEAEAFSAANDYLSMDIEEHIDSLETEAKRRGLTLPNREEYAAQFMPNDEGE